MRNVKISVTQFRLRPHKNFESFTDSVLSFMKNKVDIVVFGEWLTLGLLAINMDLRRAKPADIKKVSMYTDNYIEFFSKLAREKNQIIVGGTTVEEYNGKYYDTCFIFDPYGKIHKHRKTHLFPLERNEWGMSEDDTLNMIKIHDIKIGTCICYESQIPECSRTLALKGAEMIFCPSLTLTEAGYHRIRHACEARAIENQLIMVMSSVVGNLHPMEIQGIGRSSILSPCDIPWPSDGIVADGIMNRAMVVTSRINIDDIYVTREKGAARPHKDRIRRAELYKKWY